MGISVRSDKPKKKRKKKRIKINQYWLLSMSLIYQNSIGASLSHKDGPFVESIFISTISYRVKPSLYYVNTPFIMKSKMERIKREKTQTIESKETSAQRKRKLKKIPTPLEADAEVVQSINRVLPQLINEARKLGHLSTEAPSVEFWDNNAHATLAANVEGCGNLFVDECQHFQVHMRESDEKYNSKPFDLGTSCNVQSLKVCDIMERLVQNNKNNGLEIRVQNHDFIIPSKCSFLMCDFNNFVNGSYNLLKVNNYDLIVLDPPWANKSIKRKKSYCYLDEEEFTKLPVIDLGAPGCLVCVWVTNNSRLRTFVKEVLFPRWGVEYKAEWIWVKITTSGDTVRELTDPHKKPYEWLILGRLSKDNEGNRELVDPPGHYVIASVPCALHSKKPVLQDILSQYLSHEPKYLELFARNLLPNWTSWGNEPLRHQHSDYFERVS